MALKEFKISLTVDVRDESRFDTVEVVLVDAARNLYAAACLIAHGQKSKPQVKVVSRDYFDGEKPLGSITHLGATGMLALEEP